MAVCLHALRSAGIRRPYPSPFIQKPCASIAYYIRVSVGCLYLILTPFASPFVLQIFANSYVSVGGASTTRVYLISLMQ